MTKSKGKSKVEKKKAPLSSDELLKSDLEMIKVPFDLYSGLALVTEELSKKDFVYTKLNDKGKQAILTFEQNNKECDDFILINIEKENLLVRHFDKTEEGRKLRVLYVVKPTERSFELIASK